MAALLRLKVQNIVISFLRVEQRLQRENGRPRRKHLLLHNMHGHVQ